MNTQLRGYTIPTIDLSAEIDRQVIIDQIPGQYLGHPSTILMPDNRTIFLVYPLGHGNPSTVLRKSTDTGITWSDRLPVPDNWAETKNCPYLHRLIAPNGGEQLIILSSGDGIMSQAVSLDGGQTWSPFQTNGLRCHDAANKIVPISGNRHLVLYNQIYGTSSQTHIWIWQAVSSDGGLTWDQERLVLDPRETELDGAAPDEPSIIRSPNGEQILCLMRENARKFNSLMMVSDDEGETWSDPVELSGSLAGDRHMPQYTDDGRLVITFRDMAHQSPTQGDFVAWVGEYSDIVNGHEGQYRVRLLDNKSAPGDTGYSGLELLPNGTFVATTYCVIEVGQSPLVISTRFCLSEIDDRAISTDNSLME